MAGRNGTIKLTLASVFKEDGVRAAHNALASFNRQANAVNGNSALAQGLANASVQAELFGAKMQDAGGRLQGIGDTMTKYVTAPVVAGAGYAVKAASDMETAFANVRKTVDASEQEYKELYDACIEMSKAHPVSAAEVATIESLGAQLGISTSALGTFAETVYGLDIATNLNAEDGATQLAQFANICGTSESEISNVASTLVELGNTSATTEADIMSLAMRLAASGTQVGMSEADILGLAASMSSLGITAEAGGSAVSTIIANIDKDVALGTENLGLWASTAGMSADEFANAWKEDPVTALADVMSGLQSATEEGGNMALMLEDLGIEELRQTDAMKRMSGNADLLTQSIGTASEAYAENTALGEEVANFEDTFASKLEVTKNKLEAVAIEMGGPLLDAASDLLDQADPLIKLVTDAVKKFTSMSDAEKKAALKTAAVAAAAGPLVGTLGRLLTGVGRIATAFGGAAGKLAGFATGIKGLKSAASTAGGGMSGLLTALKSSQKLAGLANVAMGGLASVGIAAVVAAAGYLYAEYQEAKQHTEDLTRATGGLETAFTTVATTGEGSAQTVADSFGSASQAADDALQHQIELADQISQTWAGLDSDSQLLDGYIGTIERLQGKSELTAAEQAELKTAVDGFNQMCGTSIEIIDPLTGKLSEQMDTLYLLANAYKYEAEVQAAQSAMGDLRKQQIENTVALTQAQDELTAAQQAYDEAAANGFLNEGYLGYLELKGAVDDAEQKVSDLEAQQKSCDKAMEVAQGILDENTQALYSSSEAIESFARRSEGMSAAFEEAGVDSAEFAGKLSDLGVSTQQLGTLTDEQLAQLVSSYDGSYDSIIAALGTFGVELETKGTEAAQNYAAGIQGGGPLTQEAWQFVASSAGDGLATIDPTAMGTGAVTDYNAAVSAGAPAAQTAGATVMASTNVGLTNPYAMGIGSTSATDYSSGVAAGEGGSAVAGRRNMQAVNNALSNPKTYAKGTYASSQYSSGVGAGADGAFSAASSVGSYAYSGLEAGSDGTYSVGQNFTTGFRNGSSSIDVYSAAYNIGKSALNAIKAALGIASPSKEARKLGRFFTEGFAMEMDASAAYDAAYAMGGSALDGLSQGAQGSVQLGAAAKYSAAAAPAAVKVEDALCVQELRGIGETLGNIERMLDELLERGVTAKWNQREVMRVVRA